MNGRPDTLNFFELRDLALKMINDGQGKMCLAVRSESGKPKTKSILRRIVEINGKEVYLMD
jgi:hypothetical protein